MKLEVLDTNINIFLELDKSKVKIKDDGTSTIILKTDVLEDNPISSVLFLEFNEKYTNLIQNSKLEGKVLFIQGTFQVLKNKKDIPFAKVNVFKVVQYNKSKALPVKKLRNKLTEEFRANDLRLLREKYKKYCIDEEIKELKDVIEQNDILENQIKLNRQELTLKELENKILKEKRLLNKERPQKTNFKQWYEKFDDFVDICPSKIELNNEIFHTGNVNINLKRLHDTTKDNHVAIRKIGEDQYELIMGIGPYMRSKILDKSVKAHITDLDRDSFIEKINERQRED